MTDQSQAGNFAPPHGSPSAGYLSQRIRFNRSEFDLILRTYGRLVAEGECRDYTIGMFSDYAAFCMHKRASEAPSWTVEKRPELARRQGAFAVVNATGQILKRGHELAQVLKVFDKKRFDVVD